MLIQFVHDYPKLAPRDQAGAIRNVATGYGIEIDKAALLRGQPTEIVEHRHDVGELWSEFAAMFPGIVNGEAVEITDAEIERVSGTESGTEATTNPSKTAEPRS
jgi:hypothetical protein